MLKFATIEIKSRKARKLLSEMESQNLLQIISESELKLDDKKKKRARQFLKSYREAQLGAAGKIKLLSAETLLNEL